jgi:O-antigen/teichoic acid export membrane protein
VGQIAVAVLLVRFQPAAADAIRVYLFSIPSSLMLTYLSTMAQGLKRFGLFNMLRIASSSVYILVLILSGALGYREAKNVVAMMLGGRLLVASVGLLLFWMLIHPSGRFDFSRACHLLKYGMRSYLGNLSWMANARLDQFVMSMFMDLAALGQYAVAVSYATVLFPLSGAFAMILFPNVAANKRDRSVSMIKQALMLNSAVTAGGAVILALLSPFVLPWLFGADFSPAVVPSVILLVGTVVLGCNYVLSDGLRGLGFPMLPSVAEALGLAVTVSGLVLLVPRFGIYGAAWASVLAYVSVLMVLMLGARIRFSDDRGTR